MKALPPTCLPIATYNDISKRSRNQPIAQRLRVESFISTQRSLKIILPRKIHLLSNFCKQSTYLLANCESYQFKTLTFITNYYKENVCNSINSNIQTFYVLSKFIR